MTWLAVVFSLAIFAMGYVLGLRDGTKDTERRWADAVEKARGASFAEGEAAERRRAWLAEQGAIADAFEAKKRRRSEGAKRAWVTRKTKGGRDA